MAAGVWISSDSANGASGVGFGLRQPLFDPSATFATSQPFRQAAGQPVQRRADLMGKEIRGAYGFHIVPPAHVPELPDLSPLDADFWRVALEWRHAAGLVERSRIDDECVSLAERGKAVIDVRRDPPSITVDFPDPTTPEAVVHPLLTPLVAILARWRGDVTLHAGSFFEGGKAWAVVGAREAGKSTTLAKLAERGCPLLADDLLVLDDGIVRAGPACIDLRPDVAQHIPGARSLGKVGTRPRYRLTTPQGPPRAPLGGFFLLDWSENGSEAVEVDRVPTGEVLGMIYRQEYIGLLGPGDPQKILGLLGTPMWRIRRPRDWAYTDEMVDRLVQVAAGEGD